MRGWKPVTKCGSGVICDMIDISAAITTSVTSLRHCLQQTYMIVATCSRSSRTLSARL